MALMTRQTVKIWPGYFCVFLGGNLICHSLGPFYLILLGPRELSPRQFIHKNESLTPNAGSLLYTSNQISSCIITDRANPSFDRKAGVLLVHLPSSTSCPPFPHVVYLQPQPRELHGS